MEKMKKNNKGFSLVELIIVIAIMAVLVGIVAPQYLKYVERSRESTDVKNAQEIASSIGVSIANGEAGYTTSQTLQTSFTGTTSMSAPTMKAKDYSGQAFSYTFNVDTGEVHVYAGTGTGVAPVATAVELYPTVESPFNN